MRALGVRARTSDQPAVTLSGGNQQKVALARLLHQQCDILLLDEPTRGIDIGSKAQIYEVIAQAADEGKAVLVVSSYLPELFGLCDRLAVMSRGRLTAGAADRASGRRNPCCTRPSTWRPSPDMTTVTEAEQVAVAGARRRQVLARLGPFLGLIAVIAVFALMTDSPVAVPLRPQLPHRRRADGHRRARRDRHDDDHRERRDRSLGRIGDRADRRRHGPRRCATA